MRYLALLLALSLLVACGDDGSSEHDHANNHASTSNANNESEAIRERASDLGLYHVAYETTPAAPGISEDFTMVVRVFTDDSMTTPAEAVTDLEIAASMPDHGHGMNTRPVVTPAEPGVFLVEGMNFHMPGRWLIEGTLSGADASDTDAFRFHVAMR